MHTRHVNNKKRKSKAPQRLIESEAEGPDGSSSWAANTAPATKVPKVTKVPKITNLFKKMDRVQPHQEIGRVLDLPGGLFSSGKVQSKLSRSCKIINYDPQKQLKDSCEAAFQFEDLTHEHATENLWVTVAQYQKCRHNWFQKNPDKYQEFKAVLTELQRLEDAEVDNESAEEEDEPEEVACLWEGQRLFKKDSSMKSKAYDHFEPVSEYTDDHGRIHRTWRHLRTNRLVKQIKVCTSL